MKKFLKIIGVVILAGFFAITLTGCDADPAQNNSQNTEVKAPAIDVKTEVKKEPVSFQTTNENDSTLASGQTKVKQEGRDGEKEIVFKVTYTDGKETAREQVSDKITIEPVNKIVLVGTKLNIPTTNKSTSETYTPPSSNPAGATARCKDGTYSYSQNRRGTCSHHGGVAQWL